MFSYSQVDLRSDEFYFLDTFKEIYFWIGCNTRDTYMASLAEKTVNDYAAQASQIRGFQVPVENVREEVEEPTEFTRFFHGWTPKRRVGQENDLPQ